MNWLTNPVVENEISSDQFNLIPDQSFDPYQTNSFPSYNSNIITNNNNGPTCNMTSWDQQYLQQTAPMNNFAMSTPTTGDYYPFMVPPESFPLQNYYIPNDEDSCMPLQEPTNFADAGGVKLLDPNWDAIGAFLAGHVRPGADVTQVYRCGVCNVEFANPQALGGHMTAHSKGRKKKEVLRSNKSKKFKKTKGKNLKTKKIICEEYSTVMLSQAL